MAEGTDGLQTWAIGPKDAPFRPLVRNFLRETGFAGRMTA